MSDSFEDRKIDALKDIIEELRCETQSSSYKEGYSDGYMDCMATFNEYHKAVGETLVSSFDFLHHFMNESVEKNVGEINKKGEEENK